MWVSGFSRWWGEAELLAREGAPGGSAELQALPWARGSGGLALPASWQQMAHVRGRE